MTSKGKRLYKTFVVAVLTLVATLWVTPPLTSFADNDTNIQSETDEQTTEATEQGSQENLEVETQTVNDPETVDETSDTEVVEEGKEELEVDTAQVATSPEIPKDLFAGYKAKKRLILFSKSNEYYFIYHNLDNNYYWSGCYTSNDGTLDISDLLQSNNDITDKNLYLDEIKEKLKTGHYTSGLFVDFETLENDTNEIEVYDSNLNNLQTIKVKDILSYADLKELLYADETIEPLKVTNFSYDYIYEDNSIVGANVTLTTNKSLTSLEKRPLIGETNYEGNNTYITVHTSKDVEATLHLYSSDSDCLYPIKITGITSHNEQKADEEIQIVEPDNTKLEVTFDGVPAKGTYKEGDEVTITMRSSTPSHLSFADDFSVQTEFVKELQIVVDANGDYEWSAVAENGQSMAGIYTVDWLSYTDENGNPISDDDPRSPVSPNKSTWTWEQRNNPWSKYVDSADAFLVQTGIYEKKSSLPMLVLIWVSIASFVVVGGFIYYKKGVKKNEEK